MSYINPETVLSPRRAVRSVDVLYNSGPGGWSVALVDWESQEKVAVRWNGEEGPGVGNPQSRAKATWFILPDELASIVREKAEELNNPRLLDGYRAMASDREREAEAQEWCEGLIDAANDAANQER